MCEKNLERKQLSLFPNDEDDINEETIVDNDINDDIDDTIVKPSKRKKRSKKKKKICKTCSQDTISLKKRGVIRYNNTYDQELAKEYCKEHERIYGDKCKPVWCRSCKHLKLYQITVTEKSRKMTPNFDKKRK